MNDTLKDNIMKYITEGWFVAGLLVQFEVWFPNKLKNWKLWKSWRVKVFHHHCSSASLCTWRSPVPPYVPTLNSASALLCNTHNTSLCPGSASVWSPIARSLASTSDSSSTTSTRLMTGHCLKWRKNLARKSKITFTTPVLKPFCKNKQCWKVQSVAYWSQIMSNIV